MNNKAFIYNAFSQLLYVLAYPFIELSNSAVSKPAVLIYTIARCSGYNKELALALVKQAQLETANFTSEAFIEANNLFGMRHPKKRSTLSIGKYNAGRNHSDLAVFKTAADSVLDRLLWDVEFNNTKFQDADSYMKEVKEGDNYATDPDYISKWNSITPQIDNNLGFFVAGFYSLVAIALVLYKFKRK